MVYSLCMEANRTARLSSQPPSRLSEHEKTWEQRDGLLKERARRIVDTYLDIAEIEHSFKTFGIVETYV